MKLSKTSEYVKLPSDRDNASSESLESVIDSGETYVLNNGIYVSQTSLSHAEEELSGGFEKEEMTASFGIVAYANYSVSISHSYLRWHSVDCLAEQAVYLSIELDQEYEEK